jgi:hypothetical protein
MLPRCVPDLADCSGDSVLAPITGADFRMRGEAGGYGSPSPRNRDEKTMGMSLSFRSGNSHARAFIPPNGEQVYKDDLRTAFRLTNPGRDFGIWSWAAPGTPSKIPRRSATSS